MLWLVWLSIQATKTFSISAIRLFHSLIVPVFTEIALFISFKNFPFAFTSWLTGINLYASQEATVRTGHGTTDWFQIGKGVHQGCILSPCLFNFDAEYIMRNAGLDEAQAGIKTARRNINNLRYANDTTLMAESEEELKASWWKWKRRVKKLA